jgi:hypothetical protein
LLHMFTHTCSHTQLIRTGICEPPQVRPREGHIHIETHFRTQANTHRGCVSAMVGRQR